MQPTPSLDLEIVRRSDRDEVLDYRRLNNALRDGSWRRIATGAYAKTADWLRLLPIERHRARVREVVRRLTAPAVISHWSAAALHDIDALGPWPKTIDVSCAPARGGRSSGMIRRHPRNLDGLDVLPPEHAPAGCGRHVVTTPAQTALDLARVEPFVRGVSIVDQAIWSDRSGGALTTIDEIMRLLDSSAPHRGNARALRAISFAQPLAANVR